MLQGPIFEAAKGGALLGLATSISYVVIGRIIGMSGLLASLITFQFSNLYIDSDQEYRMKLALLGGLLFAGGFSYTFLGMKSHFASGLVSSPSVYLISGFLVGLGTRLGGGCTSGHGLCGLPRFSLRSITAVFVFLTTGMIAASLHLRQYIPEIASLENLSTTTFDSDTTAKITMVIGLVLFAVSMIPQPGYSLVNPIVNFICGSIFSYGLIVSGMVRRQKVDSFLDISEGSKGSWDISLFAVLMVGVLINVIAFNFVLRIKEGQRSLTGERLPNPQGQVDLKLLIGSILFGLGWGIGSTCPGPAMVLLTTFQIKVQGMWMLGCIAGMYMERIISKIQSKMKTS